ncbi:MAG: phenylalanine--tRNA ligase subunit beta [Candidatus Saccharibacteria bacterium]|nr:phenylalanine--tRNA ligase subunit beta [Candidatus Saccharibacteria bacterium]
MIISLNWLKKFTDIDMPVDELVKLIGARLVEIENVVDLGEKYKDALIVKIVEAKKLEGSDHLNVTKIDDGGVSQNIERDENGHIQVVCGAPNVRAQQLVVWLPPNSVVPETYGADEPFLLGARKLLGVTSNGMIASARELDLYDEHEGIFEVEDDVRTGTTFASVYELDDFLLDIENKSLTHRPDCFGIVGFAREVAAIVGKPFHTPRWLADLSPNFGNSESGDVEINVAIDDPELSSRYMAVVMSEADGNRKSPIIIQTYLARVGVRPISAVVDVTNYLMMLTGQPLHAFDYDKLVAVGGGKADIHVRAGLENEELGLLDGKKIKISNEDIVISAGETAVALAGAMGGANTEIDENTKNIVIESATFNLYNLRATQMRHGIFSEAITRFTKGQPADLTAPVLFEASRLMNEWAGAKTVSKVADAYPGKVETPVIHVPQIQINETLGCSLDMLQITDTLINAEFEIDVEAPYRVLVKAPYWRADVHIPEDVIEEVGRLNGFDNITPTLPSRDFTAVEPNSFDVFRSLLRKILVRAGANEVLSYSFVHGNVLEKAGQEVNNSYKIVNSISPDLQYYRQTLTPSLLDLVHPNVKQGFDNFALFEINKAHSKKDGLNDEKVPIESELVSLVVANKNSQGGAPYYLAKKILDYLCESLGVKIRYEPIEKDSDDPITKTFEYRRSARLFDVQSGDIIGVVGEYKNSVIKGFKLPQSVAGFELSSAILFDVYKKLKPDYKPLSRYPSSERDVCFQVNENVTFSQIINSATNALQQEKYIAVVTPIDIYEPVDGTTKNITVRIKLTATDHTLTGEEVNNYVDSISNSVVIKTGATII